MLMTTDEAVELPGPLLTSGTAVTAPQITEAFNP